MKKFGSFILGAIVGAMAVYLYCCNTDTDVETPEFTAPKGLITPSEALALDKGYNLRHQIISDSLFKNAEATDNRSSWFAIDEINNYITYAKSQADSLGYTLDGLRLYAGAYPDTKNGTGLMTMFVIPTGTQNVSKGSLFPLVQSGSKDIKGANGLNHASSGQPPGANYPQ